MRHDISSLLENAILEGAFPGAVCYGARRDETVFHEAIGNLGVEAPFLRPVKRETIYDLASVSKIYTLGAAFITFRRARIALDTPLQRFSPTFDARITLQLLMAHASGIGFALQKLESVEARDWLPKIVAAPLHAAPGTQVLYSCTNFWLLARIIEKVSGASLDSVIESQILQPLQLKHTFFEPELLENVAPTERIESERIESERIETAHFHKKWKRARPDFFHGMVHDEAARSWRAQTGTMAGNAGLFASAQDVASFARIWTKGAGILHPADAARAFESLFPENSHGRGLGFQIDAAFYMSEFAPVGSAGHLGFTGPSIVVTPRDEILVILNNRVHPTRLGPNRLPFHREIAARFFEADISQKMKQNAAIAPERVGCPGL